MSSEGEPPAKRARMAFATLEQTIPEGEAPVEGMSTVASHAAAERSVKSDVAFMVDYMAEDEIRNILKAEAERNPKALESLREYFDITRKNSTVRSIEYYTDILRVEPPIPGYYGPIASAEYDDRWSDACRVICYEAVNHRSPFISKQNAVTALRTIGRWIVRQNDPRLRMSAIIIMLRKVLLYMTTSEREETIAHYGTLQQLSDFHIDLPQDYMPDWLEETHKCEWTGDGKNYQVLHMADFEEENSNSFEEENEEEDMRERVIRQVYGQVDSTKASSSGDSATAPEDT